MKYLMISIFLLLLVSLHAQDNRPSKKVRKQFAGTWSLIAVENTNADGSKTLPYGESPVGLLVFTNEGDYAIQILKSVRPKVAAMIKTKLLTMKMLHWYKAITLTLAITQWI